MKNEQQSQNLLLKLDPRSMFLLRDESITQGEKRETSTKTCNETMLRVKLRVFVSRISPPYVERSFLTYTSRIQVIMPTPNSIDTLKSCKTYSSLRGCGKHVATQPYSSRVTY